MPHLYNLAATRTGLECACVNNDDFTVQVSGGSRCRWVSMYTVWSSNSKWLSKQSNESASNLSLIIPLCKLFWWFRRPQLWTWFAFLYKSFSCAQSLLPRHLSYWMRWPKLSSNFCTIDYCWWPNRTRLSLDSEVMEAKESKVFASNYIAITSKPGLESRASDSLIWILFHCTFLPPSCIREK